MQKICYFEAQSRPENQCKCQRQLIKGVILKKLTSQEIFVILGLRKNLLKIPQNFTLGKCYMHFCINLSTLQEEVRSELMLLL